MLSQAVAFIKHAEHKLLTLSTVNLQHGRGGEERKTREQKKRAIRQKEGCDGETGIKATVLQSV